MLTRALQRVNPCPAACLYILICCRHAAAPAAGTLRRPAACPSRPHYLASPGRADGVSGWPASHQAQQSGRCMGAGGQMRGRLSAIHGGVSVPSPSVLASALSARLRRQCSPSPSVLASAISARLRHQCSPSPPVHECIRSTARAAALLARIARIALLLSVCRQPARLDLHSYLKSPNTQPSGRQPARLDRLDQARLRIRVLPLLHPCRRHTRTRHSEKAQGAESLPQHTRRLCACERAIAYER